jgi:hypothetical protein
MQHDQGLTRSHWTPPSGNYLLCIAPAAATGTINKTLMSTYLILNLLAISKAVVVRRYYTAHIARWKRFMAFLKSTKRRHWVSICSNRINRTCLPLKFVVYFIVKSSKKATK